MQPSKRAALDRAHAEGVSPCRGCWAVTYRTELVLSKGAGLLYPTTFSHLRTSQRNVNSYTLLAASGF